jgi:hypothetical protein
VIEKQFQTAVVDMARWLGWSVYHTHDSRRSEPGFPDLVLVSDRVIFAELKTTTGVLAPAQRRWLERLAEAFAEDSPEHDPDSSTSSSGVVAKRRRVDRARHPRGVAAVSDPRVRFWPTALAKTISEGRCRVGPAGCDGPIETAHTIGRKYDADVVDPVDVVPLCRHHHTQYDARRLDLLPYLSHAEQAAAVSHVGIVRAYHRLTGGQRSETE